MVTSKEKPWLRVKEDFLFKIKNFKMWILNREHDCNNMSDGYKLDLNYISLRFKTKNFKNIMCILVI